MQLFTLIFEVIKAAWNWVYLFSPIKFTIIYDGSGGAKFRWGRIVRNLTPGFYFGTSGDSFRSFEVKLCKSEIDDAVFCFTSDAVPLEIYAVFTYNILDPSSYMTNAENTHWLLAELVETRLRETIEKTTFSDLICSCEEVNTSLLSLVQQDSNSLKLGVEMVRARLSHIRCTDPTLLRAQSVWSVIEKISELSTVEEQRIAAAIIAAAIPVQNITENGIQESSY